MSAVLARRTLLSHPLGACLPLVLAALANQTAQAQTVAPASTRAANVAPSSSRAAPLWTLKMKQDFRWQQVTPSGTLLVSTDAALTGVDIDRGQVAWEKPELGGLPPDSVRMVDGSLLMEAARPGLLMIFDPATGASVFDSRRLSLAEVVTRRVLPQTGTLLVHGRRTSGPAVVALFDLATGDQRWVNETLFDQTEPKKKGLGGLVQGLVRRASEGTALQVLQAGPEVIVVHTLMGLRALDARTGETRWSAALPTARAGSPAKHVQLYPSLDKNDRIYVSFDDRLMAYRLADGQPLWAKPATVSGWIRDIVQHPAGIVILPEGAPEGELTGSRTVKNGVVQTGLNVARYEDGTTVAQKAVKMRGDVIEGMIAGDAVVLAVDADSKTYVNVLDVATATVRLKKDVKIKGRLDYAELTPAGLLYVSRPDATTNAEVNVIDLASGEPRLKDAIESGKPLSSSGYDAERYYLHHAVEGRTLYVFANRDHQLYAVDRDAGTYKALGGEIKLQGGEDPIAMEIRPDGIVLVAPQNLVVIARDGQVKQQVYHPAPQASGLLRALYAVNAVRAGLRGAAASAYGDAFAQASRRATDPAAQRITSELATAFTQGGAQLQGYARQSAAMATKRFKASLAVPGSVFMLTKAPEGKGNVLLQIDKDSGQPRARVDLGKEKEPVYAVDDIAGMLFLRTSPGTLVGYRL
ncbi:MAG TPA: PQQ-binding-like beta-propeller repeat protein [Gemmatimonadales bacterium]|nr:PQQ-binding-like beta-propeller repeat protein [Gemmatimonadales bacterium]